jgi:hypothetical protein
MRKRSWNFRKKVEYDLREEIRKSEILFQLSEKNVHGLRLYIQEGRDRKCQGGQEAAHGEDIIRKICPIFFASRSTAKARSENVDGVIYIGISGAFKIDEPYDKRLRIYYDITPG